MVGPLLARGLLAGLVAGVAAAAVAFAVGEPQVERALAFEAVSAAERGAPEQPELVSRGVQRTAGLATGVVATGVALGGLLALAFAWAYGRAGRLGARATAALLASGAFVTVTLVPFAKYPANPPAVGDHAVHSAIDTPPTT
ncbi:MAG: CbtA family protein, partial [Thermoleophilaceae bacterium]